MPATRLLASLAAAGGLPAARHRASLLRRLSADAGRDPAEFWSAAEDSEDRQAGAACAGRCWCVRKASGKAFARRRFSQIWPPPWKPVTVNPARALFHALRSSGVGAAGLLVIALVAAAGGTLVEALLFRGLLDINTQLNSAGQRAGALGALWLFSLALLLLEIPMFASGVRLGRQIENRLRVLFLEKFPSWATATFRAA